MRKKKVSPEKKSVFEYIFRVFQRLRDFYSVVEQHGFSGRAAKLQFEFILSMINENVITKP